MNRLYWIVALAGLLWSCGGKKEEELTVNPIDSTTYKPLGYVDGVLSWASPQSYSVNTYYTLVDTVTSPVLIAMPLSVTTTEEESVSISWLINDQSVAGTTQQKGWDQISPKWFYSSTLAVPTNPYKASIPVKAVVYFQKTSKTANRTATLNLKQTKKTTDVLGVNFGMTREQVRQAEAERLAAEDAARQAAEAEAARQAEAQRRAAEEAARQAQQQHGRACAGGRHARRAQWASSAEAPLQVDGRRRE